MTADADGVAEAVGPHRVDHQGNAGSDLLPYGGAQLDVPHRVAPNVELDRAEPLPKPDVDLALEIGERRVSQRASVRGQPVPMGPEQLVDRKAGGATRKIPQRAVDDRERVRRHHQDADLVKALPDALPVQRVLADEEWLQLGERGRHRLRAEVRAAAGHALDPVLRPDPDDDVRQVHDQPLGEQHGYARIDYLHRDVGDLHRSPRRRYLAARSADVEVDLPRPQPYQLAIARVPAATPDFEILASLDLAEVPDRHGADELDALFLRQPLHRGVTNDADDKVRPLDRRHAERSAAVARERASSICAGRTADQNIAIPDRKSTRLNSSHSSISYAVFCLKKKNDILMHNETRHPT